MKDIIKKLALSVSSIMVWSVAIFIFSHKWFWFHEIVARLLRNESYIGIFIMLCYRIISLYLVISASIDLKSGVQIEISI